MKKQRFLFVLLPVFLIGMAFSVGAVYAEIDATVSEAVVSDPGGTTINPDDNVDGAGGILDDFNRANGPIGGNWTNQAGTFQVVSNAAQGGYFALATYDGVTSDAIEADVGYGATATVQYTGLVLAYADINNNYMIKVQDNTYAGNFNRVFFYYGNMGTLEEYFDLDSAFTTAHMKVELVGNTVTLTFSEIDGGSGTQTYNHTYSSSTGGNAIGICGFDTIARIDNFATPGCDYCFEDSVGYVWHLNVIDNTPFPYLFLSGTVDMGSEVRTAVATYNGYNCGISFTADEGSGCSFNYNFKFDGPTGYGVGINVTPSPFHDTVEVNLCGAASDAITETEGPRLGFIEK